MAHAPSQTPHGQSSRRSEPQKVLFRSSDCQLTVHYGHPNYVCGGKLTLFFQKMYLKRTNTTANQIKI